MSSLPPFPVGIESTMWDVEQFDHLQSYFWGGKPAVRITKEFKFEASHVLPRHPGKCSRLHGHSWVLKVSVDGPVNSQSGFVMDYAELKKSVIPLIDRLDHHHLGVNEFIPIDEADPVMFPEWWLVENLSIYPTSENLISWIGEFLINECFLQWSQLELNETCTSACVLTREEYNALRP